MAPRTVLDAGVIVTGVTFDDAPVNLTAMKQLGCDLNSKKDI